MPHAAAAATPFTVCCGSLRRGEGTPPYAQSGKGIVGRPAHRPPRGGKTPPYKANRKREMPLGSGRHICRPYKAAESPRSLILLSLRLLNQISKRFSLNFRKIFCFRIVKRRHLWYDADKNKDVPTRGLCALLGASFLFIPPARQMCDAARFNGIGKGANEVWKTLPSARPPPAVQPPV